MPKVIRGVRIPKGFMRWAARRLARRIPRFYDGKYAMANWMIRKHMKKKTLRRWVREFKNHKK